MFDLVNLLSMYRIQFSYFASIVYIGHEVAIFALPFFLSSFFLSSCILRKLLCHMSKEIRHFPQMHDYYSYWSNVQLAFIFFFVVRLSFSHKGVLFASFKASLSSSARNVHNREGRTRSQENGLTNGSRKCGQIKNDLT